MGYLHWKLPTVCREFTIHALFPIAFGNWIFMHPISTITSLFHHHAKDWILWLNHTFIHCKISRILGFRRFNDSVRPKLRFFTLTVAITQLLPMHCKMPGIVLIQFYFLLVAMKLNTIFYGIICAVGRAKNFLTNEIWTYEEGPNCRDSSSLFFHSYVLV